MRAHADAALVISAHDPAAHVEQLLYRSSLQSLLDFVFVLLCQANPDRHRQLAINLERIHHLLESCCPYSRFPTARCALSAWPP